MTVRSVAKAAGCSTTGVYTWFGGKNGLVDAIFIDGFERFGRAVNEPSPRLAPLKRLNQQAIDYREWALRNPTQYAVMFGHAVPDYEPSQEAMVASLATFEPLVDSTAAAIAAGDLEGDARDVARHLWASIHGYVSLEVAGMNMRDTAEQARRRYAAGMARALRAAAVHLTCRPRSSPPLVTAVRHCRSSLCEGIGELQPIPSHKPGLTGSSIDLTPLVDRWTCRCETRAWRTFRCSTSPAFLAGADDTAAARLR